MTSRRCFVVHCFKFDIWSPCRKTEEWMQFCQRWGGGWYSLSWWESQVPTTVLWLVGKLVLHHHQMCLGARLCRTLFKGRAFTPALFTGPVCNIAAIIIKGQAQGKQFALHPGVFLLIVDNQCTEQMHWNCILDTLSIVRPLELYGQVAM